MIDHNFKPLDLKKFLRDSKLLQPHKESVEGFIGDFFWNALKYWESDPEKAYKNAREYVSHVEKSIFLDFMYLIDSIGSMEHDDILNEVLKLESRVFYDFDRELLRLPKAVGLFYQMDMDDCIVECNKTIEFLGDQPELNLLIANCQAIKLRFTEAIPFYRKALASKIYMNQVKANLAYCYLMIKKNRKARKYFKQVVDVYAENYKVQYNMALCYTRIKRNKKALIYLNRAENIEKEFSGIYATRGHVNMMLGNKNQAKKDLKRAKELGNNSVDVYFQGFDC